MAHLEQHDLIVTPQGVVIDAHDGTTVATALDEVYYSGPHIAGNRIYFAGGTDGTDANSLNSVSAWQLSLDEDQVQVQHLWRAPVAPNTRIYSTPIVYKNHLFVMGVYTK